MMVSFADAPQVAAGARRSRARSARIRSRRLTHSPARHIRPARPVRRRCGPFGGVEPPPADALFAAPAGVEAALEAPELSGTARIARTPGPRRGRGQWNRCGAFAGSARRAGPGRVDGVAAAVRRRITASHSSRSRWIFLRPITISPLPIPICPWRPVLARSTGPNCFRPSNLRPRTTYLPMSLFGRMTRRRTIRSSI